MYSYILYFLTNYFINIIKKIKIIKDIIILLLTKIIKVILSEKVYFQKKLINKSSIFITKKSAISMLIESKIMSEFYLLRKNFGFP